MAFVVALGLAGPVWAAEEAARPPAGPLVLLDTGRYHLGDGVFNRYAADGSLLAQEVAGWKYSIPFRLGREGAVSLIIGKVIGVDSGSTLQLYLGVKAGGTVYLEHIREGRVAQRTKVGLIEPHHNHESFQSDPIPLQAGTYVVTVESNPYTLFDRDDIQIEDIAVRTNDLELAIEPLWAHGKVYSGRLDLSLVPRPTGGEDLGLEVAAPTLGSEEPALPTPSVRRRGEEGLELELEVTGRKDAP
ncbi:MAG: hypothetical protein ACE5H5_01260 [Nitrospinota bacterium]